jgi:hypothetical protein
MQGRGWQRKVIAGHGKGFGITSLVVLELKTQSRNAGVGLPHFMVAAASIYW